MTNNVNFEEFCICESCEKCEKHLGKYCPCKMKKEDNICTLCYDDNGNKYTRQGKYCRDNHRCRCDFCERCNYHINYECECYCKNCRDNWLHHPSCYCDCDCEYKANICDICNNHIDSTIECECHSFDNKCSSCKEKGKPSVAYCGESNKCKSKKCRICKECHKHKNTCKCKDNECVICHIADITLSCDCNK